MNRISRNYNNKIETIENDKRLVVTYKWFNESDIFAMFSLIIIFIVFMVVYPIWASRQRSGEYIFYLPMIMLSLSLIFCFYYLLLVIFNKTTITVNKNGRTEVKEGPIPCMGNRRVNITGEDYLSVVSVKKHYRSPTVYVIFINNNKQKKPIMLISFPEKEASDCIKEKITNFLGL